MWQGIVGIAKFEHFGCGVLSKAVLIKDFAIHAGIVRGQGILDQIRYATRLNPGHKKQNDASMVIPIYIL